MAEISPPFDFTVELRVGSRRLRKLAIGLFAADLQLLNLSLSLAREASIHEKIL